MYLVSPPLGMTVRSVNGASWGVTWGDCAILLPTTHKQLYLAFGLGHATRALARHEGSNIALSLREFQLHYTP